MAAAFFELVEQRGAMSLRTRAGCGGQVINVQFSDRASASNDAPAGNGNAVVVLKDRGEAQALWGALREDLSKLVSVACEVQLEVGDAILVHYGP